MIFVTPAGLIDMGNLQTQKEKKTSWSDGEKFKMIFVKEMNNVKRENIGCDYKRSVVCSNSDGSVYRYEDSRSCS